MQSDSLFRWCSVSKTVIEKTGGQPHTEYVRRMLDQSGLPRVQKGSPQPASFHAMVAEQPRNTWVDAFGWRGLGWFVQSQPEDLSWNHSGYNPGPPSGFHRFGNGIGYACLFNGASKDRVYTGAYVAQAIWDDTSRLYPWSRYCVPAW